MKIKKTLLAIAGILATTFASNAAQFVLFNVQGGPGTDTLFANNNGSLMDGSGFVTIGYFSQNYTTSDLDTIPELVSLLGGFTSRQTAVPGTSVAFPAPGYLAEELVSAGSITGANTLIGRQVYAIASSAASLATATATDQFSLFLVGTILDDASGENQYTGNPAGINPIIGTKSTIDYTGTAGFGPGTYDTLNMAVVPEPSAALLGAIGVLGLLRRRRA